MKKLLIFLLLCFGLGGISYAGVEGYDWYLTSNWVEFDEDCFREGDSFYMYDWSTSNWHIIDIENIGCYRNGCEIEIYDWTISEYRHIDLEDDLC